MLLLSGNLLGVPGVGRDKNVARFYKILNASFFFVDTLFSK